MLGRYRLDAVIGRGGMGVVFRAVDERLDRTVAIKVLAPDLVGDPLVQERFLREARVAAAVEHPHIVPVFEAASAGGVDYIAMRYVPGSDLGRVLRREAPLDPTRALAIIEQVGDALDAAHARGLVHRDVKPSNVLLEDRGGEWAWLSDFGLTKRMDGSMALTREGLVGTLEYIAPEAIEHGTVDGRSDQYALACVAYHCLSGRPPFVAESEAKLLHAHLHDTPPPLGGGDAASSEVDAVLRRALAKQQAERFPSCRALAMELRRAVESTPVVGAAGAAVGRSAAPQSPTGSTPATRSDRLVPTLAARRRPILGAMLLAGVVGGSMYLLGQPRQVPGDLAILPSNSTPASIAPTTSPTDRAVLAATASLEPSAGLTPRATPSPSSLTNPDGVLVFAANRGQGFDIWAVSPDGGEPIRIIDSAARERSPSVSADGTRIVYAVGRTADREIWLIDSAGDGRPQQLTKDSADDFAPAISPDGRHIAWVSDRTPSGHRHIFLMTDTGKGFAGRERYARDLTNAPLTAGNHSQEPSWFPDSRRIAFQSNDWDSPDIWHVPVRGRRVYWTRDFRKDFQPTVGPDDTIVFIRQPGLVGERYLYSVTGPKSRPRQVSDLRGPNDVDFSPNGQRLVVAKGDRLLTMNPNGGEEQRVEIGGGWEIASDQGVAGVDWAPSVALPR